MLISDDVNDYMIGLLIFALFFTVISLFIALSGMSSSSDKKYSVKRPNTKNNNSFSIDSDSRHHSSDSGHDSGDSGGGDGGGGGD